MRDYYSTFGLATCTTSGTAVECPNYLDLGKDGGLGYRKNLTIIGKLTDKPLKNTDTVTIDIYDSSDASTWVKNLSWTSPKKGYEASHRFKVPLPKEHQRYMSVKVTVTGAGVGSGASSVAVTCYFEEG